MNEDIKYYDGIMKTVRKFSPLKIGGCFQATRFLINIYPELREKTVLIKNREGKLRHCVAITPNGKIIDTQHYQFRLLHELDERFKVIYIFEKEGHEKYLPYFKYEEE